MIDEYRDMERLNVALRQAIEWCRNNLKDNMDGLDDEFRFDGFLEFIIEIDEDMIPDVAISDHRECEYKIMVNPKQIEWYISREKKYEEMGMPRTVYFDDKCYQFHGGSKYDLQSVFVHEIVEFVMSMHSEVFRLAVKKYGWGQQFVGVAHFMAWKIENINRIERGLKPWCLN